MSLIKEYFAEEIAENSRNHPEWNIPTGIRTELAIPVDEDVADIDFDSDLVAKAKPALSYQDKTCVAMICEARWWLPSLRRTITVSGILNVVDWPADAEFIKNVAYDQCGLEGVVWDEHANIRSDDEAGWLCSSHANGDKSALPTITMQELLQD